MRQCVVIFGLMLAVLMTVGSARAQSLNDQLYNRWIRKKPLIDSIAVDGNSYFTSTKIRSILFSRTQNVLREIKSERRIRVQRETLMRDTSEVKYLYLSSGFLGVRIDEIIEPLPPDSNAMIKLIIDEGKQFFNESAKVAGNFEERFRLDFNHIVGQFKAGGPVDPFALKQATYDIKSILANNGYPYALADYYIDTSSRDTRADIIFTVDSDSLVHFGNVNIFGADNFHPSLVRRELTFQTGDVYRRDDIIRSQRRLLETGYYITLQLNSAVSDTNATVNRINPDFILRLREKNPHYVSIKTGASQDSIKDLTWTTSITWGKRNIFRSRRLELSTRAAFVIFTDWRVVDQSYRIRFTEPWFAGIRMPLTLTGEISPEVRDRVESFRSSSWLVSAVTERRVRRILKMQIGVEYKSVKITGLSIEDQILLRQKEEYSNRSKMFLTLKRDTRNNFFTPSGGSLSTIRMEYVGGFLGGDNSYTLLEGSWAKYQVMWPGWISATRLKGGKIGKFGGTETIPVDARFYIGGANSVRGFRENLLGPLLSEDKPEGAEIYLIANREFRYPLVGKFWGSVFFDAGNGFKDPSEIKWVNIALSYGVGIQFISPAGPIRLDYARRVKTRPFPEGHRLHFTILYAF